MSKSPKPDLLIFDIEVRIDQELFARSPLYAIHRYLSCFDEAGTQKFDVPQHVLEELARRFQALMRGEANSLDVAFGGRVARQRNSILHSKSDYAVVFDVANRHADAKSLTALQRAKAAPLEHAFQEVAEARGMSTENVARIYKKAALRD